MPEPVPAFALAFLIAVKGSVATDRRNNE